MIIVFLIKINYNSVIVICRQTTILILESGRPRIQINVFNKNIKSKGEGKTVSIFFGYCVASKTEKIDN